MSKVLFIGGPYDGRLVEMDRPPPTIAAPGDVARISVYHPEAWPVSELELVHYYACKLVGPNGEVVAYTLGKNDDPIRTLVLHYASTVGA